MLIGCPKEIKIQEGRVGLIPSSVADLVAAGHEVIIQTQAGTGIGCSDQDYIDAGAAIISSAEEVFAKADMIVKVKEPLAEERSRLRKGQILFTYLHLAPDLPQTDDLVNSGATCIAYETVTSRSGALPLLFPMSEVAGRLAPQVGAQCLENNGGGSGVLLGGVPGVDPAKVIIIGGGVSGTNAARVALGMGADVTIVDRNVDALRAAVDRFGTAVKTVYSNKDNIARLVKDADLVIGTVLVPGAAAPKLVTREMIKSMKAGSAIVDVAIDQGGCFETSKATTHAEPTYVVDEVVHYCVANMPGCVARTSAFALNNATLPFTLAIANKGWKQALIDDEHLRGGLNVHAGHVTYKAVADAHGKVYVSTESILGL
ncbi:MAG: alanine dehydrogenase [Cohaesibacteraceae bacterium]|nr:alanine dehydrogenase [Cohaesibacteraceae bacterium]